MEADRRQRYLESLLRRGDQGGVRELVPLINRWTDILSAIPGLQKRRPGTHCRVAALTSGILSVEADHPAWMQLLQWHETELVHRLTAAFPALKIRSIHFRLVRAGETVERPTVVMPEPVKAELTPDEQSRLDELLAEMEGLIRKNTGREKPL